MGSYCFIIILAVAVLICGEAAGSGYSEFISETATIDSYDSSNVVLKNVRCHNIIYFVNDVTVALSGDSGFSEGCVPVVNCSIYFRDLSCSLLSFVDSMLNRHMQLNYVMPLSSEICAGLNRRKHEQHQYGHVVQFILDVVELRHWVSLVLFVDEEDDFPSASLLHILAARNVQALILTMSSKSLEDPETIVPSTVSQYYRLVVISRRYHYILEAAEKRNLFLHPYKWVILSQSTSEVVHTLTHISLQFAKDLTIVSPVVDVEKDGTVGLLGNFTRRLMFVCENANEVRRIEKNYLVTLSAKEYHVEFFAMLCRERGLDLISSGTWKRDVPSVYQRMSMSWPPHRDISSNNFKGCVFRVVVAHNPPYTILNLKDDGNFTLSGYDYDVFVELANLMKFGYEFYVVKDGQYGRLARSRQARWTGLVGELVAGNAHLALPSLVLTEERYQAVDFSARISTAHTKVLIRRPPATIGGDSYIAPFDIPVWCLFVCNVALFSVTYLVVNMHSPYIMSHSPNALLHKRRRSSQPFDQDRLPRIGRIGRRLYCIWDSFFAFVGSGLQQVPEDSPACWSGRIVTVTFFLFAVIMHTSYSSTLVSYMYVLRPQVPFQSVSDLATTTDYIPCILMGSSHEELLLAHHGSVLNRIWEHSEQGLVASNEEAIERVYGGKCAFIGDNINIEYLLHHNCSFILVRLRQGGHLTRLLKKHFNPMRSACLNHSGQTTLGFTHVISVFVELVGGILLAVFILFIEKGLYVCRTLKHATFSVYSSDEI